MNIANQSSARVSKGYMKNQFISNSWKKATKEFLSLRRDCRKEEVIKIKTKGMKANNCWKNSMKVVCVDNAKYELQAGWLVGDDFGSHGTPLIPHYWVVDKESHLCWDPTPSPSGDDQQYEYICDPEMRKIVAKILSKTHTLILPPPLLYMNDGKFYACLWDDDKSHKNNVTSNKCRVKDLTIESLMSINGVEI